MNFKSVLMLFLAVFLTASFAYAEKEYNVGDRGPANGWIIYKKPARSSGWQYIEAAPTDIDVKKVWSNVTDKLVGETSTGVGIGKENTQKIIAQTGHKNSAALACKKYAPRDHPKTKGEWFLPSKDELGLMYQLFKKENIGGFKDSWYWSSTEFDNYHVWHQTFIGGNQTSNYKRNDHDTRCIRAF
jgi:hypothetical protein